MSVTSSAARGRELPPSVCWHGLCSFLVSACVKVDAVQQRQQQQRLWCGTGRRGRVGMAARVWQRSPALRVCAHMCVSVVVDTDDATMFDTQVRGKEGR